MLSFVIILILDVYTVNWLDLRVLGLHANLYMSNIKCEIFQLEL